MWRRAGSLAVGAVLGGSATVVTAAWAHSLSKGPEPTADLLKSARDEIDKTVRGHAAVVYAASFCHYCPPVIDVLKGHTTDVHVVEVDTRDDTPAIMTALRERTGVRTVPQVFVRGNFIGGHDATMELQASGKLAGLFSR